MKDKTTRHCTKCERTKPVESFPRNGTYSNGHRRPRGYICKQCKAQYLRDRRTAGIVSPCDQAERRNQRCAEYRENNTHKRRAHNLLARAIARGIVEKMCCEICKNPKAEGHHDDYSLPLEVRWLCRSCHLELHWAIGTTSETNLRERMVHMTPAPLPSGAMSSTAKPNNAPSYISMRANERAMRR